MNSLVNEVISISNKLLQSNDIIFTQEHEVISKIFSHLNEKLENLSDKEVDELLLYLNVLKGKSDEYMCKVPADEMLPKSIESVNVNYAKSCLAMAQILYFQNLISKKYPEFFWHYIESVKRTNETPPFKKLLNLHLLSPLIFLFKKIESVLFKLSSNNIQLTLNDCSNTAPANLNIGENLIGGCIVDLPPELSSPSNLSFVAQLNLNEISKLDESGKLPIEGFLYFFYGVDEVTREEKALVHYYDGCVESLSRYVTEHNEQFSTSTTVACFSIAKDDISELFTIDDVDGLLTWNWFYGMNETKLLGIHSNPQLSENEMKDQLKSNKILLLQIGENYTHEGTLSFFIDKDDLAKRKFHNCEAVWAQT